MDLNSLGRILINFNVWLILQQQLQSTLDTNLWKWLKKNITRSEALHYYVFFLNQNLFILQELFQKIDLEDDGIVFLKEIVIYLRAMNEDIDDNVDVKVLLDQYETNGEEELKFNHFCVSLLQILCDC